MRQLGSWCSRYCWKVVAILTTILNVLISSYINPPVTNAYCAEGRGFVVDPSHLLPEIYLKQNGIFLMDVLQIIHILPWRHLWSIIYEWRAHVIRKICVLASARWLLATVIHFLYLRSVVYSSDG